MCHRGRLVSMLRFATVSDARAAPQIHIAGSNRRGASSTGEAVSTAGHSSLNAE